MNIHLKRFLLSTVLVLPVTALHCNAMEQPNAFQQKMSLAIHDYFTYLAEMKAQELGIVIKEVVMPLEKKENQQPSLDEKIKSLESDLEKCRKQ